MASLPVARAPSKLAGQSSAAETSFCARIQVTGQRAPSCRRAWRHLEPQRRLSNQRSSCPPWAPELRARWRRLALNRALTRGGSRGWPEPLEQADAHTFAGRKLPHCRLRARAQGGIVRLRPPRMLSPSSLNQPGAVWCLQEERAYSFPIVHAEFPSQRCASPKRAHTVNARGEAAGYFSKFGGGGGGGSVVALGMGNSMLVPIEGAHACSRLELKDWNKIALSSKRHPRPQNPNNRPNLRPTAPILSSQTSSKASYLVPQAVVILGPSLCRLKQESLASGESSR